MQIVTRETGNQRNFERKYLDVVLFWWEKNPVTTLHNILLFLLLALACYEHAWTDGKLILEKLNFRGTTEVIEMNAYKREREGR